MHYIVAGRLVGDNEDTLQVITTTDKWKAMAKFERALQKADPDFDPEDTGTVINYVVACPGRKPKIVENPSFT